MRHYTSSFLTAILLIMLAGKGANAQIPPKITHTINTHLQGMPHWHYIARDEIKMQPGFVFSATANSSFTAQIDAGLLFPPTENTYALPDGTITNDSSQGAVVGSIPGEFAVSPTGAATYTIPIEVPAGINGMQPKIAISYSSQAGYGTLGTGWNISGISAITRGGKNIYFDSNTEGIKFDNSDALYLDGQRLIKLSGSHFDTNAEYATEVEDYSRVKILANNDNEIYFQITTQDGKVLEYGKTEDSKMKNEIHTLSWKLNKTIDPYGNSIIYTYTKPISEYNNQLSRIEYGGQSIIFSYSENNTYKHEVNIKDFKITQSKLLESITTKVGTTIIKKYQFEYNQDDKLTEVKLVDGNSIAINSSIINWGKINNQAEFNFVGNAACSILDSYPEGTSSVDFADINGDGYKDRVERWIGNSSSPGFIKVYFFNNVTKSYSSSVSTSQVITYYDYEKFKQQYLFVDINNDGKEDIIYTNNNNLNVLTYKNGNLLPLFSDGRGVYNTEQLIYDYNKDKLVKLIARDVNHDNYADIVIGFYNKGIGQNGRRGYAIFFGSENGLTVNPVFDDTNTIYRYDYFDFGDFNADGKLDMFCIASKDDLVQPSINDEILFNHEFIRLSTSSNKHLNNFYTLEPSMFKVIDLNSDGLSDWLFYSSTDDKWRINKPNGNGIGLYDSNTTILPFNGKDCQYVDINGDGAIDVVNYNHFYEAPIQQPFAFGLALLEKYDYTEWSIYINNGNGEFLPPQTVIFNTYKKDFYKTTYITDLNNDGIIEKTENTEEYNKFNKKLYTVSDINGDGITDLMVTHDGITYALSLPQANHQNLVYSVTNGMGLTESVSYKNISEHEPYNPNEANAKIRPLRAHLLVTDTHTHIDNSKTVYTFEAPKYHTEGKGFLGFAVIKTSNADNNVKSANYYEFNQTYFFPALNNQSVSSIGGSSDITFSSQVNSVKVIDNYLKRYIPYASIQDNTDKLKNLTQTTVTNYDQYPNNLTQTITAGDLITTTITTFTGPPNKTPFLPSNVSTTRTQDGASFTKETDYSFIYDGTNPYKITEKTETVDPGDKNSLTTIYSNFDPWGHPQNISITSNGITRNSTVKYYINSINETNAGQYLRSRTNELEETSTYNWNETTGLLDSETDPRRNTTTYLYTSFGQLKETVYPDGLRKTTTLQWAGPNGIGGATYYSYSETSGSAPVVVWYDALGRTIQTDTYGLDEKKISVSTEYYTENDFAADKRKGMIYRISEPYFEANAGNKVWTKTLTYDQYGRTVKAIIPMGELTNQYNFRTTTVTTPESTTVTTLNSAGQVLTSSVNGKTVTYEYYPSGLLKKSKPQDGLPITMAYNKQGKQVRVEDPNSGTIRSEYNGFGELTLNVQRVHSTGDSIRTINIYKPDGRLDSIIRNSEITSYSYSPIQNFQSRINTIVLKNKNKQVQNRQTFTYDPSNITDRIINQKEEIVDNSGNLKEYVKSTEYDVLGRVKKEVYPSGYYIIHKYDRYSNITEQKDGAGRLIWKAIDENAKGQFLHIAKGTKITAYDYYANGLTKEIKADDVVDMYYEYESQTHNLHSREDKLSNYTNHKETFGYDELNRLTSWEISRNGTNTTHSIVYDEIYGTIKSKSDLGAFTLKYGGETETGTKAGIAGGALTAPHALTSIAPNQGTTGLPLNFPAAELNVSYTDFKKIATLSEGSKMYHLTYGADDERIKSEYYANGQSLGTPTLTRYYLGDYEEEIDAFGNVRQIHYLSGAVMIRTNGVETLYYSYTDYQGSLIALTDVNGAIVERYAYDPWGARRNQDNWTEKDSRTTWIINRGYTGHEHIDAFGIINMNGRVYDPLTAQFYSPDPVLTDAGNWLDYNRFGYCLNNPFRYTDPSGYTWWAENGSLAITTATSIIVGGVVAIVTGGAGVPAMIQSGIMAGAAGGFTGGVVGTVITGGSFGDAMFAGLQGAAIGAVMSGVTAGIGIAFGPVGSGGANFIQKAVWEVGRAGVHALAQGGFTAMRGGDFWQGAAAGFVSSLAGSFSQGVGINGWGMVGISTAMGGVGAAIAGGKSEDILFGMVSGAMVGMLNHLQHQRIAKHYANRNAAYEYMYKNSFDENGNPIREVAGWNLSDGGVLVLPFERNGKDFSEWKSLPIYKTKTGRLYLQFNGKKHFIESFIHTHPIEWNNPNNPIGLSSSDITFATQTIKMPVQIIYRNTMIYSIIPTGGNSYTVKYIGTWY